MGGSEPLKVGTAHRDGSQHGVALGSVGACPVHSPRTPLGVIWVPMGSSGKWLSQPGEVAAHTRVGGSCRLSRGGEGTTHPLPSRKRVSGAHVRGDAVPFRLASAMLFSISRGMCLLCESPPLLHGAQLVPAWQGMPLLRGFYLIPTTRALCQKNTTVQNICEDVKACPEPSKYRCAKASEAPAASVVRCDGRCAFPMAGDLP